MTNHKHAIGLRQDGHAIRRTDGTTYCVCDTPEAAAHIVKLESDRAELVAALRGDYPESYQQWAQPRYEAGVRCTVEDYHSEMRYALLRELGELGETK
jgi:hypothetical protein